MKMWFAILGVLVGLDQGTSWYLVRHGRHLSHEFGLGFGITYAENYGVYWNGGAQVPGMVPILASLVGVVLAFVLFPYVLLYERMHPRRRTLSLSLALLLAAWLGNLVLDRIFYGFVPDFFRNPIAISNWSDIYMNLAVALLAGELLLTSSGRRYLSGGFSLVTARRMQSLQWKLIRKRMTALFPRCSNLRESSHRPRSEP